jgi:hypothetical protein
VTYTVVADFDKAAQVNFITHTGTALGISSCPKLFKARFVRFTKPLKDFRSIHNLPGLVCFDFPKSRL